MIHDWDVFLNNNTILGKIIVIGSWTIMWMVLFLYIMFLITYDFKIDKTISDKQDEDNAYLNKCIFSSWEDCPANCDKCDNSHDRKEGD